MTDWADVGANQDLAAQRDASVQRLRRVLGLLTELGRPASPATTDIDDDPALASYQVAALSPLGAFDRQRLLGADTVAQRLDDLISLLDDAEDDLRSQLELG